jgi:hypothetical protein
MMNEFADAWLILSCLLRLGLGYPDLWLVFRDRLLSPTEVTQIHCPAGWRSWRPGVRRLGRCGRWQRCALLRRPWQASHRPTAIAGGRRHCCWRPPTRCIVLRRPRRGRPSTRSASESSPPRKEASPPPVWDRGGVAASVWVVREGAPFVGGDAEESQNTSLIWITGWR